MGRFGIGARVRDSGGDEGVVTAKKKGERLVKYDFELFGSIWNTKGNLTALADNDNISPETSESAYSGDVVARGKFVNTPSGDTAVVDGDVDDKSHVWVRYTTGQRSRLLASWLTAWVPKVGERVRVVDDRGGGKIGDEGIVTNVGKDGWHKDEGAYLRIDGLSGGAEGLYACHLEPVVAPATTATPTRRFKVGDVVNYVYNVRPQTSWQNVIITKDDGKLYYATCPEHGEGGFYEDWLEPAAPPAKFKVGDRVQQHGWGEYWCTVVKFDGDNLTIRDDSGPQASYRNLDDFVVQDTIPVGATVTFTATGRLSAYTTDGHAQIVFPGLTPGQNSFALPAKFVTAA